MAESKRHDWGLIVAGVLLVLLAIFITAFPGLTLATITAILGAGFLVSGILDLVGYVRLKGNLFTSPSPWMIVYAVLDIIIGIMLLLHPIVFAGVVSWLVGIFVVAFGVIEVVGAVQLHKFSMPMWGWMVLGYRGHPVRRGVLHLPCDARCFLGGICHYARRFPYHVRVAR
mgnify:CR=1 FL=1